ncbi:MAG: hypothetical protein AB8G05_16610 [Oligoflexales bacterium]
MTELTIIRIIFLSSCMIACSDSTLVGESRTTSKNFEKITILDQSERAPIVNLEQTNNEDHTKQKNPQQDSVPPEQDPEIIEDEEMVSIPAMTTGAYLASCSWQIEGLSFACEIKSDGQAEADLSFVLKAVLGALISSEFYNI